MGLRVLLVEDEAFNREIVEVILSRLGHQVTAVENGAEALALCHEAGCRYDLILVDQFMPVLNGLETIRALRGHATTRRVPILCVSARASQQACDEAFRAGCDDYLTKPFRRQELLQAIDRVMARDGRPA